MFLCSMLIFIFHCHFNFRGCFMALHRLVPPERAIAIEDRIDATAEAGKNRDPSPYLLIHGER